jgi:hypothetical protein
MKENDRILNILESLAEYHEDAFPIYEEIRDLVEGENSHAALVAISMTTATILARISPSRETADLVAEAIAISVKGSLTEMEKDNLCIWQEAIQ